MLQKYDVCAEQFSAKLMFLSGSNFVSLHVYGKILLEMACARDSEVTEGMLLQRPVFTTVKYNSQNVITGFVPHSTSL